jgi:hypothetical protein
MSDEQKSRIENILREARNCQRKAELYASTVIRASDSINTRLTCIEVRMGICS